MPVPSLRPYFYGGVPHTNVTQHNSTNDAVLKVVLLRRKVHEFLTLLNGTQDYAPHFMKHMLTGCKRMIMWGQFEEQQSDSKVSGKLFN